MADAEVLHGVPYVGGRPLREHRAPGRRGDDGDSDDPRAANVAEAAAHVNAAFTGTDVEIDHVIRPLLERASGNVKPLKHVLLATYLLLAFFEAPLYCYGRACPAVPRSELSVLSPAASSAAELAVLAGLAAMVALRACSLGWRQYLRSWPQRCAVLLCAAAGVDAVVSLAAPSPYRLCPFLRPLLVLSLSKGMRQAFLSILGVLPKCLDVLVLLVLLILLYGTFGVFLFRTFDVDADEAAQYFSSYGEAYWHLLVTLTTANFPDVMIPAFSHSRWVFLFFGSYVILGVFILLALVLATVYTAYKQQVKHDFGHFKSARRKHLNAAFELLKDGRLGDAVSAPTMRQLLQELNNYTSVPFVQEGDMDLLLRAMADGLETLPTTRSGAGPDAVTRRQFSSLIDALKLQFDDIQAGAGTSIATPLPEVANATAAPPTPTDADDLDDDDADGIHTAISQDFAPGGRYGAMDAAGGAPRGETGADAPLLGAEGGSVAAREAAAAVAAVAELRRVALRKWWQAAAASLEWEVAAVVLTVVNAALSINAYGAHTHVDPLGVHWGQSATVEYSFTVLFLLEAVVRMAALGVRESLASKARCMDAAIAVGGMFAESWAAADLNVPMGLVARYVVLARLTRVARSVVLVRRFRLVLDTLGSLLQPSARLLGAFSIVLYCFCVLGVCLFGGKIYEGAPGLEGTPFADADYYTINFNDFASGLVTLFALEVVNNWQVIVSGFVGVTTAWHHAFFIAFYLVGVIVMLNVVIAFVIDSYDVETRKAALFSKRRGRARWQLVRTAVRMRSEMRRITNAARGVALAAAHDASGAPPPPLDKVGSVVAYPSSLRRGASMYYDVAES